MVMSEPIAEHDWHLFDETLGLEAARYESMWLVRRVGDAHAIELTEQEFDSLRNDGPDPPQVQKLLNGH